jgi:hypothetical protein
MHHAVGDGALRFAFDGANFFPCLLHLANTSLKFDATLPQFSSAARSTRS